MAISTNGKSPTTAKRLREFFGELLPDEFSERLELLQTYWYTLKGDFEMKVEAMNDLTKGLLEGNHTRRPIQKGATKNAF